MDWREIALETTEQLIAVLDADGQVRHANRAARQALGIRDGDQFERVLQLTDLAGSPLSVSLAAGCRDLLSHGRGEVNTTTRALIETEWRTLRCTGTDIDEGRLWVGQDVTDENAARDAVDAYASGLRSVLGNLANEQERQQRELAAWLHSGPIQRLVAVRWAVQRGSITDAAAELETVISELRQHTQQLHDTATVHDQLTHLADRHGAELDWQLADATHSWGETTDAVLVRTAREAVRNVAAHAHAHRCRIRVFEEDNHLILEIDDDGHGADHGAIEKAAQLGKAGIASSRASVAAVGGKYSITGRGPLGGCQVRVLLPTNGA